MPSPALDRALWLVGLCLAARLRRGFEMTEWFVALLELPAYVVAAKALAPSHWRRPAPWLAAGAAVLSLFCWWRLGDGLGSRDGRLPAFSTERGVVHFPRNQQAAYTFLRDTLDVADPQRERPVFAFGHNGGIAYWLRRRNPTPLTYGFTFSSITPAEAVARLRAADPPVFLVYNPTYAGLRLPTTDGLLTRFKPATRPAAFAAEEVWFSRARVGCEELEPSASSRRFRVFDCAALKESR